MFFIHFTRIAGVEERGCDPWAYHAFTKVGLRLGARGPFSANLLFRLDSGAIVSALPAEWLHTIPELRGARMALSTPMPFFTIAGTVESPLVRGVQIQLEHHPGTTYPVDFLVSEALNTRRYGLLALRDVARHFQIETEGEPEFGEFGEPVRMPNWVLRPHGSGLRVRYRCLRCQVLAWGRPGLNLGCNDCNRPLVNPVLQESFGASEGRVRLESRTYATGNEPTAGAKHVLCFAPAAGRWRRR